MAPLIGFACNQFAYLGVGTSAIASKGIFLFNRKRVHEYLFSISDTSETITSMITVPLNMVLICVPSCLVANSQNVFPISAEFSLSTLPCDTSLKKLLHSGFSRRSILYRKYRENIKLKNSKSLFYHTRS
jgi:hypothetical protein